MLYCTAKLQPTVRLGDREDNNNNELKLKWAVQRKKKRLIAVLCFLIPTFPTVYFLSLSKVLDRDRTKAAFSICNVSAKIIYAIVLMLSHSECIQQLYVAECSANAARRQFLRYVMHEVRVPLNSVTAGIGVMDKQPLDDDGRDTLQMMKAATSYMSSTLNNVLSMQKIEEGKFELTMSPFLVEDLVKTVTMAMHCMLMEKEILLETKVSVEVPPCVVGDRYRLEHVLANLLSNAIKFSPVNGKIDLFISVLTLGLGIGIGNISELRFSVTDQGPGLSEANMMTLFQPFTQLNASELQRGGGTGVGLSICKQIIELHRGRLEVQSKVGHGSTFSFGIPCKLPSTGTEVTNIDNTRQYSQNSYGLSLALPHNLREENASKDETYLLDVPLFIHEPSSVRSQAVDGGMTHIENSMTSFSVKALVVDGKYLNTILYIFPYDCFFLILFKC